MSVEYDRYLDQHKTNVAKGFGWLQENLPDVLIGEYNYEWQICYDHDYSKTSKEEYNAYDAYFYGGNRSYKVVEDFKYAWLQHIHNNPHHWQYWILNNDDPDEGTIVLEMPYNYIVEMICDWWSFSWSKGDLMEIFRWYDERKNYMKLGPKARDHVERILRYMREALEEEK